MYLLYFRSRVRGGIHRTSRLANAQVHVVFTSFSRETNATDSS